MSLLNAIEKAGAWPSSDHAQKDKKRYSELLSKYRAEEVAAGLRSVGFPAVRPERGQPGEKAFQGGLGPKRVDVSYANERHGLLLAVSIKTISVPPYGKNLKNRFSDLLTEAITLHMRFPYAVVGALFAFPREADEDTTPGRLKSTFQRATRLLSTVGGRQQHNDPGEKFENVTMLLYQPRTELLPAEVLRLVDCSTLCPYSESEYFEALRQAYNSRNPHALVGEGSEVEAEDQ